MATAPVVSRRSPSLSSPPASPSAPARTSASAANLDEPSPQLDEHTLAQVLGRAARRHGIEI
ncbi:MAG: hypothetical protein AB1Z98_17815 [Nannocystaceae bacterium]